MTRLGIFLGMVWAVAAWGVPNWRLFYIHTYSMQALRTPGSPHYRACTATMLNVGGQCRLVTNAHCFPGDDGGAILMMNAGRMFPEHRYDPMGMQDPGKRSDYDFFTPSANEQTVVGSALLGKRFVTKDLAELRIGDELRRNYCQGLRPVDERSWRDLGRRQDAYAALGFYKAVATASFSGERPWRNGKTRISLAPFASSLNLHEFFRAHMLTTFPGMSGGLVIDGRERPVGMITRHVPYQEETFFIGMGEVVRFLAEEREPAPAHPEVFQLGNHLNFHSNNDRPTGENDHGNGGENDHGNGGENDHGNGGDGGTGQRASLSALRLPGDGVLDPRDPTRMLMARCGRQIDGYADYIATLDCQGPLVARPVDGLPPLEFRRGLAERLLGNFNGRTLRGDSGRSYHFDGSPLGAVGMWQKLARGTVRTLLEVRGGELTFFQDSRDFNFIFDWSRIPEWQHGFRLTVIQGSDGVPTVFARYLRQFPNARGGTTMVVTQHLLACDGRNYLKLVCHDQDDQFEFSLSKKSVEADKMEYRLAYRTGVNVSNQPGMELIDYFYGELDVNDQGRPSAIPQGHYSLLGL